MRNHDVIVVGAGHNGLTAACYLARQGADVLVVEAEETVGGCTRTAALVAGAPDHLINLGAVDFLWIRASTVIADLGLRSFGYDDVDLDPAFAYLHPDGASVAVWRDPQRTAEELKRFSPRDASEYLDFVREQDALMDILMPLLLSNPVRPAGQSLLASARAGATRLRRVAPLRRLAHASAADVIDDRFRHPMARDLVAGMAAIAAPIDRPGSGLTLLFGGLVHRLGMSRPIGGSQALADALERCLASHGGRVRTSSVVKDLIVSGDRVTGVRLEGGEEIAASAVLCGCDPKKTLTELLPDGALSDRAAKRARSIPTRNMGAAHVKADLALSQRLTFSRHSEQRGDDLDLRMPSTFSGSLEELVDALAQARAGRIPDPLPLWSIVPTGSDPSQAPEGQDTLYLWAGWMPGDPPGGWAETIGPATDALVASAARLYDDLPEIGRVTKGPLELAEQMRVTDGQPWHVDFARSALGPLRPAPGFGSYRTPVDGLFITGAGTHPCPGVSAVPGRLAAEQVARSLTRRRGS